MTYTLDFKRLKAARIAINRSKTAAAKILRVTYVTYNGWEKGRVTPQPKHRGLINRFMILAESRPGVANAG